jgi:hypothetical protein
MWPCPHISCSHCPSRLAPGIRSRRIGPSIVTSRTARASPQIQEQKSKYLFFWPWDLRTVWNTHYWTKSWPNRPWDNLEDRENGNSSFVVVVVVVLRHINYLLTDKAYRLISSWIHPQFSHGSQWSLCIALEHKGPRRCTDLHGLDSSLVTPQLQRACYPDPGYLFHPLHPLSAQEPVKQQLDGPAHASWVCSSLGEVSICFPQHHMAKWWQRPTRPCWCSVLTNVLELLRGHRDLAEVPAMGCSPLAEAELICPKAILYSRHYFKQSLTIVKSTHYILSRLLGPLLAF